MVLVPLERAGILFDTEHGMRQPQLSVFEAVEDSCTVTSTINGGRR